MNFEDLKELLQDGKLVISMGVTCDAFEPYRNACIYAYGFYRVIHF